MKRYLAPATTPAVQGRYSLAVMPCASGAATEAPLDAQQLRALGSYEGRSPEPFALADGLTQAPRRAAWQGWVVP